MRGGAIAHHQGTGLSKNLEKKGFADRYILCLRCIPLVISHQMSTSDLCLCSAACTRQLCVSNLRIGGGGFPSILF